MLLMVQVMIEVIEAISHMISSYTMLYFLWSSQTICKYGMNVGSDVNLYVSLSNVSDE